MKKSSTKKAKVLSLIAFAIVIVGLVLSFVLNFFDGGMLLKSIPEAFKAAIGQENSFPMTLIKPIAIFGFNFNLLAWLVVVYAAMTVLAVLFFIISLFIKKPKAIRVLKGICEITILLVLSMLILLIVTKGGIRKYFAFFIGAVSVMFGLCWHSFEKRPSLAIFKVILFVLSAAVVLLLVKGSYITKYFSGLANVLNIRDANVFTTKLPVLYPLEGETPSLINSWIYLVTKGLSVFGTGIVLAFNIISLVIGAVALLVAAFDIFVLVLGYSKKTYWFNFVKYAVSLVALLGLIIAGIVQGLIAKGPSCVGLPVYVAAAVVLVQLLITLITYPVYKRAELAKSNESPIEEDDDVEYVEADYDEDEYVADGEIETVLMGEPKVEEKNTTKVYKAKYIVKNVYSGPTDDFINTLTDEEKIEFVRFFVENADKNGLPSYDFGGDNSEMFSMVFLYLGKYRPLISDNLMKKIYAKIAD